MKAFLVNYNFTPTWLLESGLDYMISDRSDNKDYLKEFPQERIIYGPNIGNVDYDKLCYLVDNYDQLPDVFLWGKTNMFKYISKKEFDLLKDNNTFTPLLTQNHKTIQFDGTSGYHYRHGTDQDVSYYENGMYHEFNNSWYQSNDCRFKDYGDFAKNFGLPNPTYLPFPPGGNFILTKEVVHRYSKEQYAKMRDTLPYCQLPTEAQYCERSYFTLWR